MINDKINEINKKDLIKLYCLVSAFQILETKKGNEYKKAYLQVEYVRDFRIIEYINIFNLIRVPTFYDFIKYFIQIKEKFNLQNTETKTNMNDYFDNVEIFDQKLIIIMVFNIEISIKQLEKKKNTLIKFLKINKMNEKIFDIIEKEL